MRTTLIFLLFLSSGALHAASEVSLPGENTLGQTTTECDEGRNNNDPRRAGKNVDEQTEDDGTSDEGKTLSQ